MEAQPEAAVEGAAVAAANTSAAAAAAATSAQQQAQLPGLEGVCRPRLVVVLASHKTGTAQVG